MTIINSKLVKHIIKIMISLVLLFYVLNKVDLYNMLSIIIRLPKYLPLFIIVITCTQIFIDVLIKREMFSIFKFKEKIIKIYRTLFKGLFYGLFMPSMVAGDAYYVYHFGKRFNSYSKIISGIFLIKVIGLIVFFVFASIVAISFRSILLENINFNISAIYKIIIIIVISIAILIVIISIFNKVINPFIIKIKNNIIIIKEEIISNPLKIFLIILFSILFYVISIGGRLLLGKIIGIELPIWQLAGIIMLVNFLVLIPVTISGIGVREGSYITLMGIFGIDSSTATVMAFLDFLISLSGIILGASFIIWDNIKTKSYN